MRRWSLLRILPAALILVGVVRDRTPSCLTWWSMTARGEIKQWVVGPLAPQSPHQYATTSPMAHSLPHGLCRQVQAPSHRQMLAKMALCLP